MPSTKLFVRLVAALIVFLAMLGACASAQQEVVLHNFSADGKDGFSPASSLIFDSAGNLYGTTTSGGAHGGGTVFELIPKTGGGWTEKVLYSFRPNGIDGQRPVAGLISDAAGNLYGTTEYGGTGGQGIGQGTVFELSPGPGGVWKEKSLHSFSYKAGEGYYPFGSLVLDAVGNLFGMTPDGGTDGLCGTVYELTPQLGGSWNETILLDFDGANGCTPYAGLILDASGNLYGTTFNGGPHGSSFGTVFELSPQVDGSWNETLLHSFNANGTNCCYPAAALTTNASGNLYSTTYGDLALDTGGTVFELRNEAGTWTEQALHTFIDNGTEGYNSYSGLIFDGSGNLYGTNYNGGANSYGTAFELKPTAGGRWTEKILHSFGSGADGANPIASLILDSSGNLYGTTFAGGLYDGGVVFQIKP